MNRRDLLARLREERAPWDLLVLGGGATGLGTAVEAAARGYGTLLAEAHDFAKGTSSRSTKLVHGGVRYLRQGNVGLVLEALRERGRLLANAPHLVHNLSFVVPSYDWWEGPFYGVGLKLYDLLAGRLGLGPSRLLSLAETLEHIPTVEPQGLRGGVIYHDAQFDDARLAVTLARTCAGLGGVPLNYLRAEALLKTDGRVSGALLRDEETGETHEVAARAVVNATGVFADAVRRLDTPEAPPLLAPSQGVHLVLDRRFLPGDSAIMVPHTDDGRVLFAVPWHGRVVVGTTDTPLETSPEGPPLEPRALPEEIEFLLAHAGRYLAGHPGPADVLSVFAGLRPLVRAAPAVSTTATTATGGTTGETAALSRDHTVLVSPSGLVTVIGGKWTTYRRMGEDTVDQAVQVAGLPRLAGIDERKSKTADLRLHGWQEGGDPAEPWSVYGSDAAALAALVAERPEWGEALHPRLPYRAVEVIWAARKEMARTVEDVLARRTRALLLDARASLEIAPAVARLLAAELGEGEAWQARQVAAYGEVARGYVLI
jgi:glycerol-3-phosphate dehydrogenase